MTRECSGCGLRHCEGRCFTKCPADYEGAEREAQEYAAQIEAQVARAKAFWDRLEAEQFVDVEHLGPGRIAA